MMASSLISSQTLGLSFDLPICPLRDYNGFFFLAPSTTPSSFESFFPALGFFSTVVVVVLSAVVVIMFSAVVVIGFFSEGDNHREKGQD